MSREAKWTWKPDTPASVPFGARISAGKSGNVATSLPASAEVLVSWLPASCMPSPESPAKRTTTESSSSIGFVAGWRTRSFIEFRDLGDAAIEWMPSRRIISPHGPATA